MALFSTLRNLPAKYWLFGGLSFLIGVLLLIKIFFPTPSSLSSLPSPSTSSFPSSPPHFSLPSPSPSIIEGRGDPSYWQEIDQQIRNNFPLIRSLPFENEKFKIRYLGPLKLEIVLKTASESAKIEALDWLSLQGIDPQSHQIIFK